MCGQSDAQRWLEQQHELLLPLPYFLITFTLPSELREVAYRHQRQLYALFFRASASALQLAPLRSRGPPTTLCMCVVRSTPAWCAGRVT